MALDLIIGKYAPHANKLYNTVQLGNTTIIAIKFEEIAGKKSGY